MKRRLLSLLLAVLLLLGLPLPGALAAAGFSDEEEVLAFFTAQKEAGTEDFEFSCDKALYERLLADSASLLTRLQIQGGIEDARVVCSERSRLIRLSQVRYTDRPWALCGDEGEIVAAMRQLVADGAEEFTLLCSPELARSLAESGLLRNYAARAGCSELRLTCYTSGVIRAAGPKLFEKPYAVVEDAAQFDAAIEAFAREDEGSFLLVFDPDFYHALAQDEELRQSLNDASMLDRFAYQSEDIPAVLRYYSVSYSQDPCLICFGEEDVARGIARMGGLEVSGFRFYLADEGLRETLIDIPLGYIHPMESYAGLRGANITHNNNTVYYSAPLMFQIKNPVPVLETREDALTLLKEKARGEERTFTFFCAPELYEELLGTESLLPVPRDGMEELYRLLAEAELEGAAVYLNRAVGAVTVCLPAGAKDAGPKATPPAP